MREEQDPECSMVSRQEEYFGLSSLLSRAQPIQKKILHNDNAIVVAEQSMNVLDTSEGNVINVQELAHPHSN